LTTGTGSGATRGAAPRRARDQPPSHPITRSAPPVRARMPRSVFEQPFRVLAVDEAHERWVDAVAEHALDVLAALPGALARHRQAEVLLRAAPRRAVLRGHAEAAPVGAIRAGSVPQRAEEEHHRAGGHHDRDALVGGRRAAP